MQEMRSNSDTDQRPDQRQQSDEVQYQRHDMPSVYLSHMWNKYSMIQRTMWFLIFEHQLQVEISYPSLLSISSAMFRCP